MTHDEEMKLKERFLNVLKQEFQTGDVELGKVDNTYWDSSREFPCLYIDFYIGGQKFTADVVPNEHYISWVY